MTPSRSSRTAPPPPRSRRRSIRTPVGRVAPLGVLVLLGACQPPAPTPAEGIVIEAIERHGGALWEDSRIGFTFRDARFEVLGDRGRYRYERSRRDPLGRAVLEVMDNDGVRMYVNGDPVELDPAERARIETEVNSVVYFAFLPYRLRDPAVRARELGLEVVAGEPYDRIEVTFAQEGGGADWDARFIHWIHSEERTLDYFAYRYSRDGGGTRFRRAVNPREIGGLLIHDWENFGPPDPDTGLEDYPSLLEEGRLSFLSVVALEDVEVVRASAPLSAAGSSDPEPDADEGLQLLVAADRASYAPGEPVRAVVRLQNLGEAPVTLAYPSAQRFELAVLDEDGREIGRWGADRAFLQVLGEETLPPGESLGWEAELPAPDAPGPFHLQARIPAQGVSLLTTLPLEVVSGTPPLPDG